MSRGGGLFLWDDDAGRRYLGHVETADVAEEFRADHEALLDEWRDAMSAEELNAEAGAYYAATRF